MGKETLKADFLGGYRLSWNGVGLADCEDCASKTIQLLQMLLYYHETGVTRAYVIDNILGSDEQVNPINNLRNTRFRLKKILEKSGLPVCDWILLDGDRLRWNPEIPVSTDVERFEAAVAAAEQEKNTEKRLNAMVRACGLFTGELLPDEIGLEWVVKENVRLKRVFLNLVRSVAAGKMEAGDFSVADRLYENAARIEPFEEEWALGRIRCAQRQGHHREALALYEKTVDLFLSELGVSPSQEFQDCLRSDAEGESYGFSSALEVQKCIADNFENGAYFCRFAEFVHCCNLILNLDTRNGKATSLVWCTVTPPANEAGDATQRKNQMLACMVDTLRRSLRSSDVFTQYGDRQFLILLAGTCHENSSIVFDRINAAFKAQKAAYGYTLSLHIVPLERAMRHGAQPR